MTPPVMREKVPEAALPTELAHSPDPFGLWQAPAQSPPVLGDAVSFDASMGGGAVADSDEYRPVAIWELALTSDSAAWKQELDRRAVKVQAIETGLAQAGVRAENLLARRAAGPAEDNPVSFAVGDGSHSPIEPLQPPEASLSALLDRIEASPAGDETREAVSFGLREEITRLAGQVEARVTGTPGGGSVDWSGLQQRFEALLDSINQQFLHFAWVDTTLEGQLIARTAVSYNGDQTTLWKPGLPPEQTAAHNRSLELAVASRIANLHTILTVSQVAGKIALAVTTPLGPLQALSLGWQFVQEVVMPLLNEKQ